MVRQKRDPLTIDMFEVPKPIPATPGSMSHAAAVSTMLAAMIKLSPYTRRDIAGRISDFTGDEINITHLDAWTAISRKKWRFPFEYARAFEAACAVENQLSDFLITTGGGVCLWGNDAIKAQLGSLDVLEVQLKQRRTELKKSLEYLDFTTPEDTA